MRGGRGVRFGGRGSHGGVGGAINTLNDLKARIDDLTQKADEKIKYATATKGDVRAKQAADLLQQAITEAEAIGNDALVQQAKVRLADLDAILQ